MTYFLACCGLPHHRRHARRSHRQRHRQVPPKHPDRRQGHLAESPGARGTAGLGSGAGLERDVVGLGEDIADTVGEIDPAAVADSMKRLLLGVVGDMRCRCCCCCCRFGCRSSSCWAMRKETIRPLSLFGSLALLAGYGLMARNVMDGTFNTLYTGPGQVGGSWYLVGRDVMRGPLVGNPRHLTSRECVSLSPRCPRFHADTKPLLDRHPPQTW